MTQAYLYKWTHVPSNRWYIGSRTAKNCHVNDGYICSSSVVKPLVLENRDQWRREILLIGEPKYVLLMERKLLIALDARNDSNSYNLNNCTPVVKNSPRPNSASANNSFYGKTHTAISKEKIRSARASQVLTKERNLKISNTLLGRVRPQEVKSKISVSISSLPKKPCNYCKKEFLPAQYGRFHGEKCKEKL